MTPLGANSSAFHPSPIMGETRLVTGNMLSCRANTTTSNSDLTNNNNSNVTVATKESNAAASEIRTDGINLNSPVGNQAQAGILQQLPSNNIHSFAPNKSQSSLFPRNNSNSDASGMVTERKIRHVLLLDYNIMHTQQKEQGVTWKEKVPAENCRDDDAKFPTVITHNALNAPAFDGGRETEIDQNLHVSTKAAAAQCTIFNDGSIPLKLLPACKKGGDITTMPLVEKNVSVLEPRTQNETPATSIFHSDMGVSTQHNNNQSGAPGSGVGQKTQTNVTSAPALVPLGSDTMSKDQATGKNDTSACHNNIHAIDPSDISISHASLQTLHNHTPIESSCCSYKLNPAQIPHNPINDEWETSSPLECELAWLVEESAIIMPLLQGNEKTMQLPIGLEFAWTHGSLLMREKLSDTFSTEVSTMMNKFKASFFQNQQKHFLVGGDPSASIVFVDACNLLWPPINESQITKRAESNVPAVDKDFPAERSVRVPLPPTPSTIAPFPPSQDSTPNDRSIVDSMSYQRIHRLREDARGALKLRYRRSDSISRELDHVLESRLSEAVGEFNALGDKPKQLRHRRKRRRRLQNGNNVLELGDVSKFLQSAWTNDNDPSALSSGMIKKEDMEKTAWKIPHELNNCEDEIAWLCEESLILLPDDEPTGGNTNGESAKLPLASVNTSTSESNQNIVTTTASAGLVTQSAEVNWDFVIQHASTMLRNELEKKGINSQRRPHRMLQRIIRYHDKSVKTAFSKRRDEIATLLLIGGYRRDVMRDFLPSHELLFQIGMAQIWTVRRMRWRHFQGESTEDNMPSSRELNSACNARLGEKSDRVNERQKSKPRLNTKKRSNHIELFPKSNKKSKSSEHAVNRNSILSEEEEEIAWLREEYEIETGGLKGYDWSYIEEYASPKLIKSMDEKGITLSKFPTVPGASKLLAMVRLNDPVVKEAFDQKRADVKYAITKKKFRRNLLGKQLPAIPKAPVSKLLHQNGTRVSNIEYPKVEYITFDKENRNKITNEGEEEGNLMTNDDTPYTSQWRCDVCQEALFDTYDEAVEHELQCGAARSLTVSENCPKDSTIASFPSGEDDRPENTAASTWDDIIKRTHWQCMNCQAPIGGHYNGVFEHESHCQFKIIEDTQTETLEEATMGTMEVDSIDQPKLYKDDDPSKVSTDYKENGNSDGSIDIKNEADESYSDEEVDEDEDLNCDDILEEDSKNGSYFEEEQHNKDGSVQEEELYGTDESFLEEELDEEKDEDE